MSAIEKLFINEQNSYKCVVPNEKTVPYFL